MKMNQRIATVFTGLSCLAASQAYAGTITDVMAPAAGEKTHAEIFADLFGGVFVANGVNFSNGVVDITRVDDDDDQSYAFLSWEAHAVAKYSHAGQSFGTEADGKLFTATGSQSEVGGQILGQPGGSDIKFVRYPKNAGSDTMVASTDPSANVDGLDHVVTYTWSVNGVPVEGHYLLFFEDLDASRPLADFDYNDLVVEVIGQPIPEPSALALLGLGGLAMLRRRR